MNILLEHERACLFHGDSKDLGEYLPENSVDAIVCDPPGGLSFMSKKWDGDRGGRDAWSAWLAEVLAPSFRALKPGGMAVFWALPRTSHWTARAVELAGFEIRDVHHDAISGDALLQDFADSLDDAQRETLNRLLEAQASPVLYQIFGTGMPKSLDLRRQIDMHFCTLPGRHCDKNLPKKRRPDDHLCPEHPRRTEVTATRTALAPAVEHWIMARKPLAAGSTYAANVLAYGTGGLNVEACRIGDEPRPNIVADRGRFTGSSYSGGLDGSLCGSRAEGTTTTGRWPPHFSLQHAPSCVEVGVVVETAQVFANAGEKDRDNLITNFNMGVQTVDDEKQLAHAAYACAPGCPVAALDAQSGATGQHSPTTGEEPSAADGLFGKRKRTKAGAPRVDKGGASRFFATRGPEAPFAYIAKAARSEKDAGLAHLPARSGGEATGREDGATGVDNPRAGAGRTGGAKNTHPTSKSIKLMTWLCKLVCPPGGTILDPFSGSGTTGVAALGAGFSFIGCELTDEYVPLIVGRIRHALALESDLGFNHLAAARAKVPTETSEEQPDDEPGSDTED